MSDTIPKTLGRYEIRRELGRGTMGVVCEAVDPALGRRVALKTIRLAFEIPPEERESFEKRFLAEARAAGALQHPGIVVVHDVGRDEATGTLYIALEYLEGRTLAEEGALGEPLEWTRALRLTAQVARALHHAHTQGIVHRDIKPANIMVLASGQAKLMDFGIAKLPASQITVAGEFFGTPSYMSPEQAGGAAVDARSDLFSLGCVLHQLLTGKRAFDGPTLPAILMRVMKEEPPPPSRLVAGLPPAVDAIVRRALAKDRDERYPDGQMLAEDIEDALAGRPLRHTKLTPPAAPEAERTRVSAPRPLRSSAPLPATPQAAKLPSPPPLEDVFAATGAAVPLRDRPGTTRRRRIIIATAGTALLVLGFLGALVVPWRGQPALLDLPVPNLAHPPATVEVDLQHNLKGGSIKVWVDDELVLEKGLESYVSQKILNYRVFKGSLSQDLLVAPGEHVVRVQVQGDGFADARRIRRTFVSGERQRLRIEVGGLIKKELSLSWGS